MKHLLLALFILIWLPAKAQEVAGTSGVPTDPTTATFIHKFSLGLPMLNFDYCYAPRNKGLLSLPYGQGEYFYNTKSSVGYCLPVTNGSTRLFSLFYDNKWGVELYYASYGTKLNPDPYQQYLSRELTNYYITGSKDPVNKWFSYYSGLLYGVTYMFHYGKYMVEPKFLMGFRSLDNAYTDVYSFKERGNNRYLNYTVTRESLRNFNSSYHAQLNFARQFYGESHYTKLEVGVKLEYMYIPYHTRVAISQQAFGENESTKAFDFKGSYHMCSIGVYYAVYIVKKHAVRVKKEH